MYHDIETRLIRRRGHTHRAILVERDLEQVLIGSLIDTFLLDDDRRLAIEVTCLELTLGDILGMHKRQRIHHAADQVVGLEHNDLVVDISVGHIQTESLHQGRLCAAVTGILLDHHRSLRIVGRNPFAVFEHRQTESYTYKDHKQIPIVHEGEDPLNRIELGLLIQRIVLLAGVLRVAVLTIAVLGIAILGIAAYIHTVGAIRARAVRVTVLAVAIGTGTIRPGTIRIAVQIITVSRIGIIVISTHSVLFIYELYIG